MSGEKRCLECGGEYAHVGLGKGAAACAEGAVGKVIPVEKQHRWS